MLTLITDAMKKAAAEVAAIPQLIRSTDREFLKKIAMNAEEDEGLPLEAMPDSDRSKQQPKARTKMPKNKGRRLRLKWSAIALRAEASKTAAIGPSPHKQFDEAFATMAYTYMREKVPSLIDYMVGFQTLDRTEDGRRAFGVFVFNVNGRILEAPVFFIDGELKGHQLLRLRSEGTFVPMRDTVVSRILQQPGASLGQAVPEPSAAAIADPDLQPFRESPLQAGVPG